MKEGLEVRQKCMNTGTYLRNLGNAEDKGTPELIQTCVVESVLLLQCEEQPVKAPRKD